MILTQAKLFGATFDAAILTNASLNGAWLLPGSRLKVASFVGASLQDTDFSRISAADFTNAAVALANGVPLFPLVTVGTSYIADLNAGNYSSDLAAAFAGNGYPVTSASITMVTANSLWTVNVPAPSVTEVGNSYATFTIAAESEGLMVYGSSIHFSQADGTGHLQLQTLTFLATKLQMSDLDDETYCPDGQQVKDAGGATWGTTDDRTDSADAPSCVPSPTYWCPALTSRSKKDSV